jgi:gliding motility-associated-like protein
MSSRNNYRSTSNMKKQVLILILTLTLFSGNVLAQCIGDLTGSISGGTTPICYNTSPGSFTATGGGESGSYTYLWYKNDVSTGVTTQTYNPGNLTVTSTFYCAISSGVCGPFNTNKITITVADIPTAPVIGTITQPTCTVSTGSVALSGLPASGDWVITILPGSATTTGNGTTTTINGLLASTTYTFKVTNYAGCISPSSNNAVIQAQPLTPSAPVVGTITQPTCSVATGSVFLSGLPASGTWTLKRYPGSVTTTGTGVSTTISGLSPGTYNFSVTNAAGCVSATLSDDVVIASPPATPAAPIIGTITQPTCSVSTGSVALSGLPSPGAWTVTLSPGGRTVNGSGTTTTISTIAAGTYTFTVTNSLGCISPASANAVINAQPSTPTPPAIGTITQPTCGLATGSVTLNSLPSGSWVVTRNPGSVTTSGTGLSTTISGIDPGTYTFTVTNAAGCISGSSASATINAQPSSPAAPVYSVDCTLGFNHAVINISSPVGVGIEYSLDAGAYQSTTSFTEVANGNHFIAVRNVEGCTTIGSIFAVSCGCINPPSVLLSSEIGTTCGLTPVTVTNNTFGGSATSVTITENGAGSVDQSSFVASPFTFTYTPANADRGRTVIITVTTNNPMGSPCTAAVGTYTLSVNAIPSAPSVGTITHLTCTVITGSVVLYGLPSTGTWSLTRSPDNIVTSGTGTSTTVTGLAAGTYTFTVTSEEGCVSVASADVIINPQPDSPTAPVVGAITQPTCAISTGSVVLSGLPATGTWTLTRIPTGVTRTGTGTTFTVTTIPGGTYTYTVTNSSGCVSLPSESLTINEQPLTPTPPSIGVITPPSCALATGSVTLMGLPATGTWTLTRYPGTIVTTGTGTSTTVSGIATGTYNFTVRNADDCGSTPSGNVIIPAQPPTPATPIIGTITQPTLAIPTGSVVLGGLPSSGAWILTRQPEDVTTAGSGVAFTVSGLSGGLYTFYVTNSYGCPSDTSADVIISTPGKPDLIITDPPAVCSPDGVDLTSPDITVGSTTGLTLTYWTDAEATIEYLTPTNAAAGTYYIKGTTVSGYFDIKPVNASIDQMPVSDAGPDQALAFLFNTTLAATLGESETGIWAVDTGTGTFSNINDPLSAVTNLSSGDNIFSWIVSKGVCPADTDKVLIIVGDLNIPTLITPNGDTKNEYLVVRGLATLGKSELIVFDRRGAMVFKNSDYDNKWNGIDDNGNPVPNDTYFYVLKSAKGRSVTGYIVVRR